MTGYRVQTTKKVIKNRRKKKIASGSGTNKNGTSEVLFSNDIPHVYFIFTIQLVDNDF